MPAHKGKPFSLICTEAWLDCHPWGETWSLNICPWVIQPRLCRAHSCDTAAVSPAQCCSHSQPLQTQLCSGVAQHGTALTRPCITISAVTMLSQLRMFHWISRITNLRDQFKTQPEEFHWFHKPQLLAPLENLAHILFGQQSPSLQKPPNTKPKNSWGETFGWIKAWTLKKTIGHEDPRRYDSLLFCLTGKKWNCVVPSKTGGFSCP